MKRKIMQPNPFLKKLGFSNNDRVVIIHTDDIGMCHASVQAFKDLWEFGTITSGATMVPCGGTDVQGKSRYGYGSPCHIECRVGKLSVGTDIHNRIKFGLDR